MTVKSMAIAAKKNRNSGPSVRAAMRPEWNGGLGDVLNDMLLKEDITNTAAWLDLQAMSNNTEIDGIYVISESAVFQGNHFIAPAVINVTLNYGGKNDQTSMTDSFPAEIKFRINITNTARKSGEISIEDITVDTRSFYE